MALERNRGLGCEMATALGGIRAAKRFALLRVHPGNLLQIPFKTTPQAFRGKTLAIPPEPEQELIA